jgi:hypothetical protein
LSYFTSRGWIARASAATAGLDSSQQAGASVAANGQLARDGSWQQGGVSLVDCSAAARVPQQGAPSVYCQ